MLCTMSLEGGSPGESNTEGKSLHTFNHRVQVGSAHEPYCGWVASSFDASSQGLTTHIHTAFPSLAAVFFNYCKLHNSTRAAWPGAAKPTIVPFPTSVIVRFTQPTQGLCARRNSIPNTTSCYNPSKTIQDNLNVPWPEGPLRSDSRRSISTYLAYSAAIH